MFDELDWQHRVDPEALIVSAIALVKVLPPDGSRPYMQIISTETLSSFEALGMLTAAQNSQLVDIEAGFRRDEEEDDGET